MCRWGRFLHRLVVQMHRARTSRRPTRFGDACTTLFAQTKSSRVVHTFLCGLGLLSAVLLLEARAGEDPLHADVPLVTGVLV